MVDPHAPYAPLIAAIRALFGPGPIPLHRPVFEGPERRWLVDWAGAAGETLRPVT